MNPPPDRTTDASETPPLAGLLVVDKPLRLTSMSVCRVVRARLIHGGAPKRVKVGHGGTLDPLATGVLVVLVGRATSLCDAVMAGEKRYEAEIDLSRSSTTDDLEGEFEPAPTDRRPALADVEAALPAFTGEILQAPPAYSAMKVGGRRAYDLARRGEAPRLEPRPVVIHELRVLRYDFPSLVLDVRCGKGTYIRSLARDLGRALTGAGMLTGLRRTAVGRWTIDDARPLEAVPDPLRQEHLLVTPEVEAIWRRSGHAPPA